MVALLYNHTLADTHVIKNSVSIFFSLRYFKQEQLRIHGYIKSVPLQKRKNAPARGAFSKYF